MMRNVLLVGLILIAAAIVTGAAQQPTFKGSVRTVAVYATVTDSLGRLVPDLKQADFEVQDNGKAQEIAVFANDLQPITVVVLLDRSGSMRGKFRLVEEAAEEFVNQLRPDDKARIGSFAERVQIDPRDFTSDHDELLRILRTELQTNGPTPLWNAVNVGITALLHQQGRRVVLVFTDGMDAPFNPAAQNNSLKDVMKRAEEEDIMVYAIGLASSEPRGFGYGGYPRGGFGRGGFGRGGFGGGGFGGRRPYATDKPDEGLPKIAAATGGGYFELTSTNDLGATFAKVADELHHQYALGFTPQKLDGKRHSLDVRLEGPGGTVRARKSYLAKVTSGVS